MPKKTTVASDPADQEMEVKPKPKTATRKKVVRKKKTEPDLSSLPNNAGPVQMDSVARPISAHELHDNGPVLIPLDDDGQREIMRDIKPREVKRDADFLVPEKFGFDLKGDKKRRVKSSRGPLKLITYTLVVLILLMLGALYFLNSYSSKMADQGSENTVVTDNQDNKTAGYTFAYANVSNEFKTPLNSILQNKFGNDLGLTDNTATLPAVTVDTLFVKDSAAQENTDILNELMANGIKAQIQQNNDITTSAVLYLTSTLANPDLTGMVAGVYNATGTTGLAKKNCDVLLRYHVTSCQPLNSTGTQKGTTINYKSVKVLFNLKRTPEFNNAAFSQAGTGQVEDIKVTLGK